MASEKKDLTWTKVLEADELPEGRIKPVTCHHRTPCMTHNEGQYGALDNRIIAVDAGNNTYSFGRYFECDRQAVLMSGYLGPIGFSLPAAMGAWAATQEDDPRFRGGKLISISGDGGFGQYLAELTTDRAWSRFTQTSSSSRAIPHQISAAASTGFGAMRREGRRTSAG